MSKLKLINILKNKILEQAPIGFYDTDEEPGVYYSSNLETGEIEKIDINNLNLKIDVNSPDLFKATPGSRYGMRIHPIKKTSKMHSGQDYPIPIGTYIVLLKGGEVVQSVENGGDAGKYIQIKHDGGELTRYLHLDERLVNVGDRVFPGTIIARTGNTGGSTGPHLHFEFKENESSSTIDPITLADDYFRFSNKSNPSINIKDKENTSNKEEIKKIEKPSYIISLNNPSNKKIALIWGGTPSSNYGAYFMEKEGEPFFKNKNVIYSNWENSLSEIENILKENGLSEYKINSISGFSKGGEATWGYINSGYDFIGLIDPSTPKSYDTLPENVKMFSNNTNWKGHPKMKKNIKKLEDNGSSKRIGNDLTYNHLEIPKLFFQEYSSIM